MGNPGDALWGVLDPRFQDDATAAAQVFPFPSPRRLRTIAATQ